MYYNSQYEHSEKDLFPAPTDRIIAEIYRTGYQTYSKRDYSCLCKEIHLAIIQ